MKEKTSREIIGIIKAVEKYIKKHKGNVQFYASFFAFKGKECTVIDDRRFAYGDKNTLLIDLKESIKRIKEEKEFVNW